MSRHDPACGAFVHRFPSHTVGRPVHVQRCSSPRSPQSPHAQQWMWAAICLVAINPLGAAAAPNDAEDEHRRELEEVAKQLTQHEYLLRYNFVEGETVYYEVIHQTAVSTKVEGTTEEMKSRSKSIKRWDFTAVEPEQYKFTHTIDSVNMWSEMTGRDPVRFDSRTDQEPPPEYQGIAKSLGQPISEIVTSPFGKIIDRKDKIKQIDRGTGGLLVPLPPQPIVVGTEWSVPASVTVRLQDGHYQEIKTRQRFRLEKVETGVATISLATQVLTPVSDARVKSQLVQKLSQGVIKFDVDAGRMISKTLDWDETIVGFNGPESNMSFMAKMMERLVSAKDVAAEEVAARRDASTTRE